MRVMAVSGSSGGHIYPALAFLSAMESRGHQPLLVVPRRHAGFDLQGTSIKVRYLPITSFGKGPASKARSALNMFAGSIKSLWLLVTFGPSLVAGFGSLNSVPVMILAKLFGIKTLLHEQNVAFGRANRLLLGIADGVAISFTDSEAFIKKRAKRVTLTGNPLRADLRRIDIRQAREFFGLDAGKTVVLVMGGSQGSAGVNRAFLDAFRKLVKKFDLQVCHLCGDLMRDELEKEYAGLNARAKVLSFLDKMNYAYSCADLVVSRAGALALSEIAYFGLPAVVIPYPFAAGHQAHNARVFASCGRAAIVTEEELSGGKLADELEKMLAVPDKLRCDPGAYFKCFFPDAAERLAAFAQKLGTFPKVPGL